MFLLLHLFNSILLKELKHYNRDGNKIIKEIKFKSPDNVDNSNIIIIVLIELN